MDIMGRTYMAYVLLRGLAMYNSMHIELLKKAIEQMKQGLKVFEEYCTEDCEHCPLFKANVCGYYLELDPTATIDDGLLDSFVDFHEGKGERNGIWED